MEYDKDLLRKLQLTQLEILKDIDAFCKDNNITYFIAYGTALGAVRHKGFIPWDDDIDICMLREDYNRFIELATEKMDDKYDILNIYNTEGYMTFFAKVSKKGTKFTEASNANKKYKQGIFVDIIPLDCSPNDKKKRKKEFRKTWMYTRLCTLSETGDPVIQPHMNKVMKMMVKCACKIVHIGLKVLKFDKIKIYEKYLKIATSHQGEETMYVSPYCAMAPEKGTHLANNIFPVGKIQFEDYEFSAPNNIHEYLKTVFGDYMKIPAEEDRHNHMASELVFGDEE